MKGTDKLSNACALPGSMGVWTGLESTEPSYAQSFTLSTASLLFNAREKKKRKKKPARRARSTRGGGGEVSKSPVLRWRSVSRAIFSARSTIEWECEKIKQRAVNTELSTICYSVPLSLVAEHSTLFLLRSSHSLKPLPPWLAWNRVFS